MDVRPDPTNKVDSRRVLVRPDGSVVAACASGLCVWDAHGAVTVVGAQSGSFDAASDGRFLVGDDGGAVHLLDAQGAEQTLLHHASGSGMDRAAAVQDVAFVPGRPEFASAGADGLVKLWKPDATSPRMTLRVPTGRLVFSPDGTRFVTTTQDEIAIWDTREGEARASLAGRGSGAAFTPDGASVVLTSPDGTLQTRAASDLAEQKSVRVGGPVLGPSVSPDGNAVAAALLKDKVIVVWTPADGALRKFSGHRDEPRATAFSRDGKTLYSVSSREGVLAWDVASGKLVRQFALP